MVLLHTIKAVILHFWQWSKNLKNHTKQMGLLLYKVGILTELVLCCMLYLNHLLHDGYILIFSCIRSCFPCTDNKLNNKAQFITSIIITVLQILKCIFPLCVFSSALSQKIASKGMKGKNQDLQMFIFTCIHNEQTTFFTTSVIHWT